MPSTRNIDAHAMVAAAPAADPRGPDAGRSPPENDPPPNSAQVPSSPWTHHSVGADEGGMKTAMASLGDALGSRSGGRSGATLEIVVPTDRWAAHLRSLSAIHGLGEMPLHVEHSHRNRPSRYVLLGCLDPGGPGAATTLLDRAALEFGDEERSLLRSAPILIRSGRRPFYSTVLPDDDAFLRYDRDCMEPVCDRGRVALELVRRRIAGCRTERHEWRAGDILVIDNWHALHGRAPAQAATGRRLARMTIDA